MGIVAYCPQGHRIKVKNQLAGRKGVCPECGARFRIPFESQPELPVPPAQPMVAVAVAQPESGPPGHPMARVVSLDADLAATLPRALPLAFPDAHQPPD